MEKDTKNDEPILYAVWVALINFFSIILDSQRTSKPKTSHTRIRRVYVGGRELIDVRKVIEVKATALPYHVERGWRKNASVHQGYFRCRLGAFKGEVEKRCNGDYKFYIFNPPDEVLTGSHKACFTPHGNGRFHIHFGTNSNNLDSGIMAVERLLSQSLNRR